jgi:nucleotide-binding universal stress UspA family protein
MFEHLLLAIDDSLASEVATVFAAAFARRCDADVRVLHVNEYLVGGEPGRTLRSREEVAALLTSAVLLLHDNGVRASGGSCAANCRHVPNMIVRAAHERGVDAIVLGSNRHHRLGRIFSPKVRERTTRLTSLPVLVAPSPLKMDSLNLDDLVAAGFDHPLEGRLRSNSRR